MKNAIFLFYLSFFLNSCSKPDYGRYIDTNFDHKILTGYFVTSIAFDQKGNAWVGTANQGLIKYNSNEVIVFDSTNSIITSKTWINDIEVDSKGNVWIGCDGLIKYDGNSFTKFNTTNSPIPEDVVQSIAIDSKDNIWFTSCRFQEGGIIKYDGTTFTVFTPANSVLPVNLVLSIAIDKDDKVWLALSEGNSYLVKISDGAWTVYTSKELGFSPYYLGGVQINSLNQPCCAINYAWGNPLTNERPQVFIFNGTTSSQLTFDDSSIPISLMVDNEDNIWCYGLYGFFAVYNGQHWYVDYSFTKIGVIDIEQSPENKVWIGTTDGIYIND